MNSGHMNSEQCNAIQYLMRSDRAGSLRRDSASSRAGVKGVRSS